MTLIPSSRQWDFGASYLWSVTTVLPNLGMEAHPAKAHGYLCDWLVETLAPAYAARGGGFGYSFLAEAYANGGWLGGPPLLFAQGLAFGALWRFVYRKHDRAHYAFGACALMTVLILARGEMGTVVRALTWQGFAPYALYRLLTRRRNRLPSQEQQESSGGPAPPM